MNRESLFRALLGVLGGGAGAANAVAEQAMPAMAGAAGSALSQIDPSMLRFLVPGAAMGGLVAENPQAIPPFVRKRVRYEGDMAGTEATVGDPRIGQQMADERYRQNLGDTRRRNFGVAQTQPSDDRLTVQRYNNPMRVSSGRKDREPLRVSSGANRDALKERLSVAPNRQQKRRLQVGDSENAYFRGY